MGRKAFRKHAFAVIFQLPFHEELDLKEAAAMYLSEIAEITDDDGQFFYALIEGTREHLAELDDLISKNTVGWTFERISKIDLAIIRMAIFEMKHMDDVPLRVAINEAVELAKGYGTDESASFVNGILGQVAKSVEG